MSKRASAGIVWLLISDWLVILVGLHGLQGGALGAPILNDPTLRVSTYADRLMAPTGLGFIGPDELLVIEKATGRVKHIQKGMVVDTVLDLDVTYNSERGLLGIAVHPDFIHNQFVYLYFSTNDEGSDSGDTNTWTENRLSRFTWNGTVLDPNSEFPLLRFARDHALANGPIHNGGPLAFGPDGKLYGTTGDLNRDGAEQNNRLQPGVSSGVGGIYRVEAEGLGTDGSPAADNPFIEDPIEAFHKWFAYGIRNTFGIAFDPVTDRMWATENGPASFDEINLVEPGFNGGWSPIMGPEARNTNNAPDDLVVFANSAYSDPEFSFLSTIGITDLAFLANFTFDARYEHAVVFGGANSRNAGRLHVLQLNTQRDGFDVSSLPLGLADRVTDTNQELDELTFGSGFGIVTDIQIGPDHAMYVLSYGGSLYRIVPEPRILVWTVALGVGWCRRRGPRASPTTHDNNNSKSSRFRFRISELSALMIESARSRLDFCSSITFSSTVSRAIRRWAKTCLVWPMRCVRSIACSSTAGFHQGSSRNT